MPVVVNRHHFADPRSRKPDRRPPLPEPWVYVGRGTALGNPFTVQEHGDGALELYREYLQRKIDEKDPAVIRALRSIREGHHLVCSCAPRPCHAHVIVDVWDELVRAPKAAREGRAATEPAPSSGPLVFAPKPALLCRLCGRARRCTGCGGRGELLTEPVHPEEAGRLT